MSTTQHAEHHSGNHSGHHPEHHPEHPLFGFSRFAISVSNRVGSASAFLLALLVIGAWAITGPIFHYSDTWQLWINTGTTIVTFLMVFLIQYTQNRDARAMHLKLDELLRAAQGARTEMINLKDMSDEDLRRMEMVFDRLARFAARARSPTGAHMSVEVPADLINIKRETR